MSSSSIWPVAFLVATSVVLVVLGRSDGVGRRHDRRVWREVVTATRPLSGNGEPDEAAAFVVKRACRLVQAGQSRLYWLEAEGRLRPGLHAGQTPELLPSIELLPADLAGKIERGPIPLAELSGSPGCAIGLVAGVQDRGKLIAVLAVAWSRRPREWKIRRWQLQAFAPWAAQVLADAQARVAAGEELRREQVLQKAGAELAGTLDRQAALETLLGAIREGLDATAAVVERVSGRVVCGDTGEREPGRVDIGLTVPAQKRADQAPLVARPPRRHAVAIEENLLLLTRPGSPVLSETDARWVARLASAGRGALERCTAHAVLCGRERRLRLLLDALPAPVVLHTVRGDVVFINAAHRSLGLPPALLPDPRAEVPAEHEVVVGEPPRTFMATAVPVADGECLATFYREVTREREALRLKDELISLLGHEIRNPLASIHGYSQMMARQLGVVQQQVRQLNQIVGDVMDASRLGSGQLATNREPTDLAELVRAAVERFRGANPGRAVQIAVTDIPPIEGDPARLEQVLDNLLINAGKYSPDDQPIVVRLEVQAGEVLLSVRDQGVGVAPEHLSQLFERFYRAPGADTDRVPGVGLGLSIVRELVAAHGGRVWAESAGPGTGSTFWVALPVSAPSGITAPGQTLPPVPPVSRYNPVVQ